MKKTAKRILLSLSVVLLFTVLLCFNASALSKSGNCGPSTDYGKTYSSSVKWSYNKSKKTLTISGKGAMGDFNWDKSPFYQANIKKLVIGEGITSVGSNAFTDCDRLTSVTLPKSLKTIGSYAFSDCDKLKTIKLPANVTTINSGAFYSCNCLSGITIPNKVTAIGGQAFSGCTSLKTLKLGKKVKTIGQSAFYSCDSLTSVTIPDSVTTIESYAFGYCSNLKTVKIGKKVKTIGNGAFADYSGKLHSITVPKTVTKLGDNFVSTETVIESTKGSAAIKWAKNNKRPYVETNGTDKTSIYSGKVGKYKWSLDKRTGVLKLTGSGKLVDFINAEAPWKKHACYIKSLSLSSKMTSIGQNAFKGLYRITSVKLPASLKTLGSSAFSSCSSLKTVTLSEKLTAISSYAFDNCTSLSKINIPDKVTEIGGYAFNNCDSLTSITLGKGVEIIYDSAFCSCDNLKTVKLNNGIKEINDWVFEYCVKLESINLPNSLTELGWGVFGGCKKLKSITIPYGVSSIPSGNFTGCEKLKKVVVYNPDCEFSSSCGIGYNQTIYGFKKSTAQKYANSVGATFKDVEKIHKHTAGALKLEQASLYYEESGWDENDNWHQAAINDGSKTKRCTVCNKVLYTEVIPAIKTVKLDGKADFTFTYTGSAITPVVAVYDRTGKALKQGTDFTVKYVDGRINPGNYDLTITFKGNYEGFEETSFKICPANVTNLTLSATSDSITAKWDPVVGAEGYYICYYEDEYYEDRYPDNEYFITSTEYTLKWLDSDSYYKIQVSAYINGSEGEVHSAEAAFAEIDTLPDPDSDWDEDDYV